LSKAKLSPQFLQTVFHKLNWPLFKGAWAALAVSAVLIILIGQFTNVDLKIEDFYYDETLKKFPWKSTWFAKDFMHGYVKNFILYCGCLLIFVVLVDAIFRFRKISREVRIKLRFIAIASVLIPSIVLGVKQLSVLHCPWDIERYGGTAPFLRLLDHVPYGMQAGRCFPAGHATTGLWLAALCVFWFPHNFKVMRFVFFAGLSAGLILGWVQQMRGAHFLFHTLWAAWLASLVILLMLTFTHKLMDAK